MNTKSNTSSSSTELIQISDIGFLFEVNQSHKPNLISPDVLDFFDGIPESEKVTKDCAFPPSISFTNLRLSIFQNIGDDWIICSDSIFRKCPIIKCQIKYNNTYYSTIFYVDRTVRNENIVGRISI